MTRGGGAGGLAPQARWSSADWEGWLGRISRSSLGTETALGAWRSAVACALATADPHAQQLAMRLLNQGVVLWEVAEAMHRRAPPHGVPDVPGAQAAMTQFALDVLGQGMSPGTGSPLASPATEFLATLAGIAHGALARCASEDAGVDGATPVSAVAQMRTLLDALERGYEAAADSPTFSRALAAAMPLQGTSQGTSPDAGSPTADNATATPTAAPTLPGPLAARAASDPSSTRWIGLRNELSGVAERLQDAASSLAQCATSAPERTPAQVCWTEGATSLVRLLPDRPRASLQPLLVVYSLVNHPSVLDLETDRSMFRRLCEAGHDVYFVDWHAEGQAQPSRSLDSYINDLLRPALHAALDDAGVASMPVLGVCQGGTLSLFLAALEPDAVQALACLVTPVDFHSPGDRLSHWLRALGPDQLAGLAGEDSAHAVPGEMAAAIFRLLNPSRLGSRRYLDMLLDSDASVATCQTRARLERWLNDAPDIGGRALAEFVGRFYQRNAFLDGALTVGGVSVRPKDVRCPVLNIHARGDVIVPPGSSGALAELPSVPRYEALELGCGHVGALVGSASLARVPPAVFSFVSRKA